MLLGAVDSFIGRDNGARVLLNDGTGFFSNTGYFGAIDSAGQPNQDNQANYTFTAGILSGDYNQDGVLDLAVYEGGTVAFVGNDFNSLSILLGTRPGEFAGGTTLDAEADAFSNVEVIPADFNNDGITDLLYLGESMISLGNGDGTFAEPFLAMPINSGDNAEVADFNNDGILDLLLATGGRGSGSIAGFHRVVLGNGDGTFESSFLEQSAPYGYAKASIADLNNDGFQDFITKSGLFGVVEGWVNNPDDPGTFTKTYFLDLLSSEVHAFAFDTGDFNEDGIVDFVTLEYTDEDGNNSVDAFHRLQFYQGNGDGTFDLANEESDFLTVLNPVNPETISVSGDVNEDGHLDFVTYSNRGTLVHLGNGDGTFETPSFGFVDRPQGISRGDTFELVDFNEDGHLDQVRVDEAAVLALRLGNGDGTFGLPERYNFANGPNEPKFADIDHDGHLDVLFSPVSGNFGFSPQVNVLYGSRDGLVDVLSVDLNGDGNEEILAINEDNDRLKIFAGDNLGGLTRQNDLFVGRAPRAVVTADLNGDGTLELITANRAGRSISVLTGDLDSGYSVVDFDVDGAPVDAEVSDLDGDGNQDIVVLDELNNALWVFAGNGTTTLDAPVAVALGDVASKFVLADANNDGDIDAVVTLPETNRVMILGGDGLGGFEAPVYVDVESAPSDVAVVDLNNDGSADLAITLPESNVLSVHYGLGNNQFAQAQAITVGETPTRVTAADADEDGRIDLIVTNSGDNTASVIFNRFDPNEVYRYDADAIDPDGDDLDYRVVDGPGGLFIDSSTGEVIWAASPDQVGQHTVIIEANDNRGGVASLTLTANGEDIPLDANGQAAFEFEDYLFSNINVVATAIDVNGNVTTRSIDVDFDIPEGWTAADGPEIPTAIISSPSDADSVTGFVSITGTAAHEDFAIYRLSYRGVNETTFTEFARSETAVENGELGVWDTSLLRNDEYIIRLEVATSDGVANVVESNVGLSGELKLGNFQLQFTDLVIPVAGIPIQITRVYDTLQADVEGEFGFGWRLEFRDTDLRIGLPESGLEDIGIYSAFRPGVKVYLNVPGEGRVGFTFDPEIRVLPGFGGENLVVARPRFTADAGVTSTLSTGVSGFLTVNERGELFAGGVPYNPAASEFGGAFVLTTEEGITYRINGATGQLDSATDRNGNTLLFSDGGITAEGVGEVEFTRDSQGRIVEIFDLAGQSISYSYDATGNLEAVIDRDGNATEFAYSADPAHFLVDVVDPLGRDFIRVNYNEEGRLENSSNIRGAEISYTYDPDNFIGEVTDPLGNTFLYEYDQQGNIVSIVDALGNATRFENNSNGDVVSTTDSLGNRTEFERDSFGNIVSTTGPLGTTTRLTYDADGNLIASVDGLGRVVTFVYDDRGNIIETTDPTGRTSTQTYDSNGNQLTSTDVLGNTRNFSYDRFGNVVTSTDTLGHEVNQVFDDNGQNVGNSVEVLLNSGETESISVSFELDANGNRTSSTDGFGNVTTTEFDAFGTPVGLVDQIGRRIELDGTDTPTPQEITLPTGARLLSEFNLNDQIIATTENGQTTRYEFDAVGNIVLRVLADETPDDLSDNPTQGLEYDSLRRITAIVDPNGNRTEFEYDAAGNQTVSRNALGNVTTTEYDAVGQVTARIDALGRRTEFQYDNLGQVIQTTFADGSTLTQAYDELGNVISTTDATGATTRFAYDSESQLVSVTNPNGHETVYKRDQFGNVILQRDALLRETVFEFDEHSRPVGTTRPLGQSSELAYTANNKLDATLAFDGTETDYRYDDSGRLTEVVYADGSSINYQYDDGGNVTRTDDPRGATNFEYDTQNRLIRKTEPDGTFVAYTYDLNSNILTITTPSGTTAYTYDELNRISTVTDSSGLTTEYEYDSVGNTILIANGNGTTESRSYDLLNRLVSTLVTDSDGEEILSVDYTRDERGIITEIADSNGRFSEFSYDKNLQLVQETHRSPEIKTRTIDYVYDEVGNRISKIDSIDGTTIYLHDDNDRLTQIIGVGVQVDQTFDENGNLISSVASNGDSSNYTFDARDRLVEANITTNGITETASYVYDDLGNRVVRVVDGVESRFLFDVNREFSEAIEIIGADLSTETRFTYGNDVISSETSGETFYVHGDAVGSIVQLTNEDGDSSGEYIYDAFGNILLDNSLLDNALRFTGEYFDDVTGFTYLRARNLNNATGRFTSEDSFEGFVEIPLSRHRFQYANNSPLTFTDPSGEVSLAETAVGVAITGGLLAIGQQFGRLLADFRDPVVFGGFSVNAAVSLPGGSSRPINIRGFNTRLSISTGASIGGQINVFGSNNLPEFVDQAAFSGRNRLGLNFTVFASAGITFGVNLPFSAGIGGFTLEVPRAFVNRIAPGLSLALK